MNEFYSNFRCLALHYAEAHHVCPHKDCLRSGFRLIAFAEEEELHLHMISEHGDHSRLSDRERKLGMKLQVGHMSYADESRRRDSKGQGKGQRNASASDDVQVRFLWPKDATAEDCRPDSDASAPVELRGSDDSDDDQDRFERYPPREPVAFRGRPERSRRPARPAAKKSSSDETGDKDEDESAEVAAGDDAAAVDDNDDDDIDEEVDEADDNSKEEPRLSPELEDIGIDCSIAADGPRRSTHSCLNALNAVLVAMLGARGSSVPKEVEDALRAAVSELNDKEIEGLHRMQKHLETASGDLSRSCDWEALERVLSLRPLFFLLVQAGPSSQGKEKIGPKRGSAANAQATVDISWNWRQWKLAAQDAVQALGRREQLCLLSYVSLCLRRRSAISDALERGVMEEAFPTLGGSGAADAGETCPAASAWAEMHQAAQTTRDQSFPSLGNGPASDARDSDSRGANAAPSSAGNWGKAQQKQQVLPGTDQSQFPTLGGGRGPAARAEEVRWGAGSSSRAAEKVKEARQVPDAWDDETTSPKSVQKPMEVSDETLFPSLGGAPSSAETPAVSWAAAARQRQAAAAAAAAAEPAEPAEPEKPKNFKLEELDEGQHFPGLPMAPKKSSPAKAAGKAASKAKAKASTWSKGAPLASPAAPASGKSEHSKKAQSSPHPKNGGQQAVEPADSLDGPIEAFFPEILCELPSKKADEEPAKSKHAIAAGGPKPAGTPKPKAKAGVPAKPAPIDNVANVSTQDLSKMDNVVMLTKKDEDDDGLDGTAAGKKKTKNNRDKKKNVLALA